MSNLLSSIKTEDYGLNEDITETAPVSTLFCICCLKKGIPFISWLTCLHADFLNSFMMPEIKLQNQVICYECHEKLKKIQLFRLQVEESFKLLSDISTENTPKCSNQKHNLKIHQVFKIDIPQTNFNNTENPQAILEDANINLNDIIKEEKEIFDNTVKSPPRKSLQNKNMKNIEEAIRIINNNQKSDCINFLANSLQSISHSLISDIHTNFGLGAQNDTNPIDILINDNKAAATTVNPTENITNDVLNENLNTIEKSENLDEKEIDRIGIENVDTVENVANEELDQAVTEKEFEDVGESTDMETEDTLVHFTQGPTLGSNIKQLTLTREQLMQERKKISISPSYMRAPHRCESCLIGFQFQENLVDHVKRKHTSETELTIECDVCLQHVDHSAISYHIFWHHTRYQCVACAETFATYDKAAIHYRKKHQRRRSSVLFKRPPCPYKSVTAYNYPMADQPDEPMDLTDLPLPSRSNAPVETQDATASTSATPFAEPPTIAAPKSKAQRQREYRQRIAASRTAHSIAMRKSDTERKRNYRLRKAANLALANNSLESTTASSSRSAARSNDVQNGSQQQLTNQQSQSLAAKPAQTTVQPGTSSDQIEVQQAESTWNTKWKSSIMRFKSTFLDNDFGYTCSVCDRLWCKNDLKLITAAQLEVISNWFIKENRQFCREEFELVCNTCKRSLNKKSMPPLAKVNGFSYPDRPPDLQPLDPICERLISPRLPFMQVRRLRHDFSYGIIGQVINVPVDVQDMVKCLPRQLNEDDVINVNIKRNLAHKSAYISGYMSMNTIKAWLDVLQTSPLYRLYEINVDLSRLNPTVPLLDDIQDDPSNCIENISAENTPESEILASRQHTMMWNEEDLAPGHQAKPLNIIYDRHAEELSFPSIYFGEPRRFNTGVSVSYNMMASSEIRRRDRRGATPQKILYVAMKILRLRMADRINNTFRNVSVTEDVTRRMLAFMKTVPNSVQYWASRKRDLFAMIRQLGKPTIFLTISANEIRWMKLLTILLKLNNKYPGKTAKDLNTSQCCTLVSDDPVTCCIYFYKLVESLMKMLKSKQSYNPFGKYSVKDYFLRIEFQHHGSPHAHILLWLNDDPHETVSENMPRTIELVETLSSVARDDVPNDSIYANQIHKHTFTCTKRGETTCRFGIPYWPMSTSRVLVPMPQSDRRRQILQQKAKELRTSLGERRYACMDDFLKANILTYASYLDIVRSTLRRPTLLFRRNFDELMTKTFNPYLAGEVNSNIDIQFILDEYSCAEYVVEYVTKSAHGMGNLRRELTTMMQEHPEQDCTGQLKALSTKLLNAVEMSAQEAAWYLLRQPMSETSCDIVYIPTVWPTERQRCRKRRQQMDREGIDGDSTNVWTKNIIQRYEERPASLEQVYLAEFASWYANTNDFVDEEDDVHVDDDENSEGVPEARTFRVPKEYRRRLTGRIIRYRRYDIDDTVNYKREMVLLYVQFRNEMSEIVDQNKFLQLFDDNKDTIMERRSLFETNLNIENVIKELEALMNLKKEDNSNLQEEESRTSFVQQLLGENGAENVDD